MTPQANRLLDGAAGAIFLASVTGLVSIAASHILLGLAIALFLAGRGRWRIPAVWMPLAAFILFTFVSAAVSGDPQAAMPQVKKLYVLLFLPLVHSLLGRVTDARRLLEAWFLLSAAVAALAAGQFVQKWQTARAAGVDFDEAYMAQRITGFFSHWMTYSQAALLVFTMLVAYLLFGKTVRRGAWVWTAAAVVIALGLVLSYTRSVWLGMLVAAGYFVIRTRPKLLWLTPAVLIALLLWSPDSLRRRIESIGDLNQNAVRIVMWRTGWNMIQDYPWFGVGPERVGPLFDAYEPDDVTERPPGYYGHLHNVYVHYWAERGVFALIAVLWLFGLVLWHMTRALRRAPPGRSDERFMLEGTCAAMLAMMTVGCFDLTLGDSEVLAVFLTVIACGYAAKRAVAATPAPSPAPARTGSSQPASVT